jgi:uncharacterized protein YbjT (DUF2867 family)
MILVSGASGTVGSQVVRQLAQRGVAVRAMSRRPETMPDAVYADFGDPQSLRDAMTGVDGLFLLTPGGRDTPAQDLAMIEAARRAGASTVVKLSVIDIGPAAQWHRAGEAALGDSGFAWTILRPTTFASNTLHWADAIRHGQPNPTGDGQQGVIDPRDVAEVAVQALVTGGHHGRTYTLTGPELLSVRDQAVVLSGVLGQPVTTVDISIAEGLPPEYAAGAELVLAGRNAILTDDVSRVLHRPPTTFAAWATDHRSRFAKSRQDQG